MKIPVASGCIHRRALTVDFTGTASRWPKRYNVPNDQLAE
jgi:hypothetical protein